MQKVKLIDDGKSSWAHIITKRKQEVINTFVEGVTTAKTQLKKGHNVYVMPQSLITRDDMGYLKDNMSICLKRKNSTYDRIILSKKYINKLVTDDWGIAIHVVDRAAMLDMLEYVIDNYDSITLSLKSTAGNIWWRSIGDLEDFKYLLNSVKTNSTVTDTRIGFYKGTLNPLCLSNLDFSAHPILKAYHDTIEYTKGHLTEENYKEFQSIWKQRNKVVTEEYVKTLVSSDNPMTLETVESMDKMLRGTTEDAELAVVTISKMDYRNNLDLLYYLVSKHENKIMWTKAMNSAGCKDLKAAIKEMPWARPDNLLENLREKGKLSKEGLKLFLSQIAESVSKSYEIVGLSVDPDSFKLKKEFNEIRS